MTVFTIGSIWLCTLLGVAGLGWLAGRQFQIYRASRNPVGWTTWFWTCFSWTNDSFQGSAQRSLQLDLLVESSSQDCTVKDMPKAMAKHRPIASAKQQAHVFDDMPPVESIRQEAKEILASENVWERADRVELMAELGLNQAKMPVLAPLHDRAAMYVQSGPTSCGPTNSGASTRVVIHPRVRNELIKLDAAGEEPAETVDGPDKVQAA